MSLRSLFQGIDVDNSGSIEVDELVDVIINKMDIDTISKEEIKEIFRSIDLDGNRELSWGEFNADFITTCNMQLHQLKEAERALTMGSGDRPEYEAR